MAMSEANRSCFAVLAYRKARFVAEKPLLAHHVVTPESSKHSKPTHQTEPNKSSHLQPAFPLPDGPVCPAQVHGTDPESATQSWV